MTKYLHTMIYVSSLEDSIAFFEVLGLHEIRRRPDEKGRGREYALDPWDAFADDQLGLMDHVGIKRFLFMGNCIGGCFAMKLMERAPERVAAGVLVQTVGHHPQHPDYMFNSGRDVWAPELLPKRPDLSMAQVERYLHDLYRARPEFVYSVTKDFARSCQTPILVLPYGHFLSIPLTAQAFKQQPDLEPLSTEDVVELRAEIERLLATEKYRNF